jgi:hypothetical protein
LVIWSMIIKLSGSYSKWKHSQYQYTITN